MFDIAPTELLLVGIVALLVIGPKDLPKAMRIVGYWVGKARGVGRQFRAGFDSMVREAELAEMEKQWAAENARIMREHPPEPASAAEMPVEADVTHEQAGTERVRQPEADATLGAAAIAHPHDCAADTPSPQMVEQPTVVPAPQHGTAISPDKAPS